MVITPSKLVLVGVRLHFACRQNRTSPPVNFSFPAGITAYTHEPYTKQGVLEYCGKYYVCGSGRQPIQRTKTESDNYYLLTLAAIAQELKYRKITQPCKIILVAGLPLAGYGREKLPFKTYLLRHPQPIRFKWDGKEFEVTIEDVKLFPQGYSALSIHPEMLTDEPSVLLMDAGGWTVDLMRLDNGKPNADTCRSLELGMIRCIDEITEQVRRDTGLSITDAQVERVLNGKNCSMAENVKQIILNQGRNYIQHILSATMESGFDLKAMPVIILGGGATVIKRNIRPEDRLCRAICLEGDRVNAEGFERILSQMSANGEKQ